MMKKMIFNVYDTSSLLLLNEDLFQQSSESITVISSITLQELEKIKVSQNKDARIKHTARTLLHLLDEHIHEYICLIYTDNISKDFGYLELNNDGKIIASLLFALNNQILTENSSDKIIFYTNDLAMKQLASVFLPIEVKSIIIEPDNYTGYKDIDLSDEELASLYEGHLNLPNIQINEYINIWDCRGDRVDTLCWTGSEFRPLKYKTFDSDWFGNIKPYKDDIFQAMAADSLLNNQITMLRGPSGAGKSHLALGYLFYLLEHNRIDKIIIFCNTVATRNAAKLGYYPGDKNEKLLDAQIGNMLSSKLGGQEAILRLIEENKLILLPMSDIRGYDTSGMNAGIYITEAQNLDITLAKLALQRVGEDCIMILDGDTESQVDLIEYDGNNNGMRRISKIFRGHDFYGEVALQKIHRSKIAELANQL